MKSSPQALGFTLIELIIVIILLGIITINALPRFSSNDVDAQSLSKELLSELRLVQLKNMHSAIPANAQERKCYWLEIRSDNYQQMTDCSSPQPLKTATPISTKINISTGSYGFDQMGRPQQTCQGGCSIHILADTTKQIRIESEGYIHAL